MKAHLVVDFFFQKIPFTSMGVGRIVSRGGGNRVIFQNFIQGDQNSEIWFLPLEIEKTTFFR